MTDFQLPIPVIDLFATLGITDSAQMLIIFLSSILGVLLVLIVLIAFRGRPTRNNGLSNQSEVNVSSQIDKPAVEPVISVARRPVSDDPSVTKQVDDIDAAVGAVEQVEDFRIFKRPKQKSPLVGQSAPSLAVDDNISTADHLRLIEKEMVRLRDLYQGGHITRNIYIDETRSLYHQARGLSSVS